MNLKNYQHCLEVELVTYLKNNITNVRNTKNIRGELARLMVMGESLPLAPGTMGRRLRQLGSRKFPELEGIGGGNIAAVEDVCIECVEFLLRRASGGRPRN